VLTTNDRFPSIVLFCFFAAHCGVVGFVFEKQTFLFALLGFEALEVLSVLPTTTTKQQQHQPSLKTLQPHLPSFCFARWRQLDQILSFRPVEYPE
jgi:hypothetical protein